MDPTAGRALKNIEKEETRRSDRLTFRIGELIARPGIRGKRNGKTDNTVKRGP